MSAMRLGDVDQGAMPANLKDFLKPYHESLGMAVNMTPPQFRDEVGWKPFNPRTDASVKALQQFLKDAGFMPNLPVNGVFGYATQAAARLFQEYVRTMEGGPNSHYRTGIPDGLIGNDSLANIETWKREKAGKDNFVCDWGKISTKNPTPEFTKWIGLIQAAKTHFLAAKDSHPIVRLVENYKGETDTQKVGDWDTNPETVHLIGIRRSQDKAIQKGAKRENDDLFILLLNGMVFRFWGSTDPNPRLSEASAIPFLVEGQHVYRYGWHHQADPSKIYQALRPKNKGVLVFRDRNGDQALTDDDIAKGLDPNPNPTINIHWSGVGVFNFSAGCQVIAGNSDMNHLGKPVDCKSFAAPNQDGLVAGKFTRGAYNVFADLIVSYAPPGVQTIRYLLGREGTFSNFEGWDNSFVQVDVDTLRGGVA